eukprot:2983163-Pyramimonas_sp.AAC.2
MKITASSDSIEDVMRLCPQLHLRGNPLLPLTRVLARPRLTKKGGRPVLAPVVDPAEPAPESECTCETASSESTNADRHLCRGNGGHGPGTRCGSGV